MNADERRDKSIIRTLESSQVDLLEAVMEESEKRHKSLVRWQATMERRYHRVSVGLVSMVAAAIVTGIVGGILYSAQASKVETQGHTITQQAETITHLVERQRKQVARNEMRSRRVNRALCVFRRDLQSRAEQSRAFLEDHPNGFAGISASSIRVSLIGQERTIMALSGLHCGDGRKGNP